MLHTKDNYFLDWSTLAPFDSRNLAFKLCLGAPAQADFTNFPLVIIVSMCWPVPGHWHLADTTPSTGVMSHVMVTCHNTLDWTPVPVLQGQECSMLVLTLNILLERWQSQILSITGSKLSSGQCVCLLLIS